MKILVDALRRFVDLPAGARELRDLLDDVGVEVRREHQTAHGTAFTLELLANRGDHYCYAGVAREVSGRTGAALRLPPVRPLAAGEFSLPVRVQAAECLVYTLTLLERRGDGPGLPAELTAMLATDDALTELDAVNASNLANLELGQPTHAFDADRVRGGVTVRLSRAGETAHPLFAPAPVALQEGTLVIADDERIIAIAGVIGCEDARVTAQTRRVLLESATFDPASVRAASRALGLPTDAAARFMRGGDPSLPLTGAGRVCLLLREHAGWEVVGDSGAWVAWTDPGRVIPLDLPAAREFVGYPFTADDAGERLARYGFGVEPAGEGALRVRVPPHRLWDVERTADLHEELARSVGYNQTDVRLPPVDAGGVPSHAETVKELTDELLTGAGFYEIFTPSFYARGSRDRLGVQEGHPLWEHVETLNAVERDYSLLRNNTLVHALDTVAANVNLKTSDVRAYEWARTFRPDPAAELGVDERRVLWMVVNGQDRAPSWADRGRPADPYFLKGVLEELCVLLGLRLRLGPLGSHPAADRLHPNRSAGVWLGERQVGFLGEVHPSVVRRFKVRRGRPCVLEIEVAALEAPGRRPAYRDPPSALPVTRNLAFLLPRGVEAGRVADALRRGGPEWLERVEVVDEFRPSPGARVLTFELRYSQEAAGASLGTAELNAATAASAGAVLAEFGARGVSLRAGEAGGDGVME